MNRAIILDRDGTLNHDDGYVHKLEDFRLINGVVDALKMLKDRFIFIVITNQSGIGRGLFSEEDLHRFNEKMIKELERHDIRIEEIYYCPHAPDEECDCRKPSIRFIKQAEKEFDIDLKSSYVIGDHPHDVELGKNAGCRTIYLLSGHGEKHKDEIKVKPDHVAADLLDAAGWIVDNEK